MHFEFKAGDRVEINSPKSFEYHQELGTIREVFTNSKGNMRYDVKMDWGGIKDFSIKSLKPVVLFLYEENHK
jgi:hypothetical protein